MARRQTRQSSAAQQQHCYSPRVIQGELYINVSYCNVFLYMLLRVMLSSQASGNCIASLPLFSCCEHMDRSESELLGLHSDSFPFSTPVQIHLNPEFLYYHIIWHFFLQSCQHAPNLSNICLFTSSELIHTSTRLFLRKREVEWFEKTLKIRNNHSSNNNFLPWSTQLHTILDPLLVFIVSSIQPPTYSAPDL